MDAEVIHGDCLEVMRGMADASVDAIVTDPPYSSGGQFRGDRAADPAKKYVQTGQQKEWHSFGGDTRDQRGYLAWCSLWLSECWRVAKPGAPVLVFTDWRQLPTTTDALQCADFVWRGIVAWDKTEGVRPTLGRFRAQAEYVVWGSKGAMPLKVGVGVLPGAYRVVVRQADKYHLTGKPTELMRALVRICPPGGVVLDPFAGSGSTGAGAVLEGRSFVGIEREVAYVKVARRRLADLQPALEAA